MYRWECGHNIDREYFLFISVDWEALVEVGEEKASCASTFSTSDRSNERGY